MIVLIGKAWNPGYARNDLTAIAADNRDAAYKALKKDGVNMTRANFDVSFTAIDQSEEAAKIAIRNKGKPIYFKRVPVWLTKTQISQRNAT